MNQSFVKLKPSTKFICHKVNAHKDQTTAIAELWENKVLVKDFVMVQGEVISDVNFFRILDFHYINSSSLTLLFEPFEQVAEVKGAPPARLKPFQNENSSQKYLYALEEGTNRLIAAIDPDDLESTGIKIKTSLAMRHPRLYFAPKLTFKGFAICSINICKVLAEMKGKFYCFTEDFLSFIAAYQYNSNLQAIVSRKPNSESKIDQLHTKHFENQHDFFRPFIYFTKEFSTNIDSLCSYHQANLTKINKGGELGCFKDGQNDKGSQFSITLRKEQQEPAVVAPESQVPPKSAQEKPTSDPKPEVSKDAPTTDKPAQVSGKKEKPEKGADQTPKEKGDKQGGEGKKQNPPESKPDQKPDQKPEKSEKPKQEKAPKKGKGGEGDAPAKDEAKEQPAKGGAEKSEQPPKEGGQKPEQTPKQGGGKGEKDGGKKGNDQKEKQQQQKEAGAKK